MNESCSVYRLILAAEKRLNFGRNHGQCHDTFSFLLHLSFLSIASGGLGPGVPEEDRKDSERATRTMHAEAYSTGRGFGTEELGTFQELYGHMHTARGARGFWRTGELVMVLQLIETGPRTGSHHKLARVRVSRVAPLILICF